MFDIAELREVTSYDELELDTLGDRKTALFLIMSDLNATAEARVKGLVELRDCVQRLIDLEMDAAMPDADIREQMAELNRLYDDFSAKYGLINDRANRLAFSDDSSYYLLCALEVLDEDGKLERKADMFTKRTIKPHQAVTTVDTASEALAVSISEKARVEMEYMEQLTGKTSDELAAELRGVIFRVPGQTEPDGTPHYVTADEYLSGNVRRKLRQAQRAAERDPAFAINVDALTAAQPKDLDASEIEVRLGATWIDKAYIQQFMYETFGLLYVSSFIFGLASTVVALLGVAVLVTYSPQNGVILLVIAFLVSPVGLPMAAAWLVSKVQDLRFAIQDAVYG